MPPNSVLNLVKGSSGDDDETELDGVRSIIRVDRVEPVPAGELAILWPVNAVQLGCSDLSARPDAGKVQTIAEVASTSERSRCSLRRSALRPASAR